MSVNYAKGGHPQDLDAAKGGLVLDRLRSFSKEADHDDKNPIGSFQNGPEKTSPYGKKGKDPQAMRTGDKSLKAIIPRC